MRLILKDHFAALTEVGPADLAVPYLSHEELPHEPRRVLLDVSAAVASAPNPVKLAEWIIDRLDNVRHAENLHAKVAIGENASLLGSANFTVGGLEKNVEAGILLQDPVHLAQLRAWFDEHWRGAKGIQPDALRRYAADVPSFSRPRPDTTGLFFDITPSGVIAEKDEGPRVGPIDPRLLQHIADFGSREAAETYLRLAEKVVRKLDRSPGDQSLTVSLPRRSWGPIVTIGTTWVLLPNVLQDDTLAVMLLLPHGVEPPDGEALGTCEVGRWWNFSLRDTVLDDNPDWPDAASLLKGPTPRHDRDHRPDALRAILEEEFREEVLARAFGDGPEIERLVSDEAEFWARFRANPRPLGSAPAVVQYWKEPSVGNWKNGATGSSGSEQSRLLQVKPGGIVYIVGYAGEGRFYVAARIEAEAGGETELGWHVVAGPMHRYAPGDDTEFLEATLELPPGQSPSTRSMSFQTILFLTPDQSEAFGLRFAT